MADNPFPAAFTATLGAVLFTVGGVMGYVINWHGDGSFGHQTGAPVRWEIGVGAGCVVAAVIFWRRALKSI